MLALVNSGLGLPLHHRNQVRLLSPLAGGHAAEGGMDRKKRDFAPLHNYIDTVSEKTDYGGEWTQQNCNTVFNCEEVSLHHCTEKGRDFECSDNKG